MGLASGRLGKRGFDRVQKSALATFEAGRSAWEKLVRAVPDGDYIEIIANGNRGIIDPDDEEDPAFSSSGRATRS